MSPKDRDDELLHDYLGGDSELSRLYRREAREQPDAALDARILAEARRAVARPRRVVTSPFARHWLVPASLAAVLVLSVSVVVLFPARDSERAPGLERAAQPQPAADVAAPAQNVRLREQALEAERDRADEGAAAPESAVRNEDAPPSAAHADGQRKRERKAATGAASRPAPSAPAPGRATAQSAPTPGTAPVPMPDDAVRADPAAWLRFIEKLLDEHDGAGARSNLRAFRAAYPDYPLPSTLAPLAASVDAERP